MTLFELALIAVGLSMDAFAVAICKGLSMQKAAFKSCLIIGLYFGIFQAAMPIIGYFAGSSFGKYIEAFDHWVVFALLLVIGGKMIYESFKADDECPVNGIGIKTMLPLALATSIDALAVGLSFAFLEVRIVPAAILIGVITFALSFAGVKIGKIFGAKHKNKAELAGGIILIGIGIKILLEHLLA